MDMLEQLFNVTIGLALGLVTGYYFERRATKAAVEHAKALEAELESVRRSVYTMGGHETVPAAVADSSDLTTLVHQRALAMQTAAGTVNKSHLVVHFVELGHRQEAIKASMAELCDRGVARDAGAELEMR